MEFDETEEQEDQASAPHGGGKLDQKMQIQKLKDRQKEKKKLRKNKTGGIAETGAQELREQEQETT